MSGGGFGGDKRTLKGKGTPKVSTKAMNLFALRARAQPAAANMNGIGPFGFRRFGPLETFPSASGP
jgi:hypothetical protein